MSDLSLLIRALKAKSVPDALAAITKAVDDLKGYLSGNPVHTLETAAEHKIEDVKSAVESAYRTYLEGKLGPQFGDLAAGLADTALNGLVSTVEGVLHGAANSVEPTA